MKATANLCTLCLHAVLIMLMFFFIGTKITATFQTSLITVHCETDDDQQEPISEKPIVLFLINNQVFSRLLTSVQITHFTIYNNAYQTGNYLEIIGPPPDFGVSITA